MKQNTANTIPATTIGIDIGDRFSYACILDGSGNKVGEHRLATTVEAMRRWFRRRGPARVALEVGTHSPWISRLLQELEFEVVIANPREIPLVTRNQRKSDRLDAENLARLARIDPGLLRPIQHRGRQAQADLALLRARQSLVRTRSSLIVRVRCFAKSLGVRLPSCGGSVFHKKALGACPPELRPAVHDLIRLIGILTATIHRYERKIRATAGKRYPEVERLQQVAGVGPLTALFFVLVIENPRRFQRCRRVASYIGLVPRRSQSGDRDPELRITKAGHSDLRWHLVQAAHYILGPFGPDTDLRTWGLALVDRGGKNAKKRALIAVARKLSVQLLRLWQTGEDYRPKRKPDLSAA